MDEASGGRAAELGRGAMVGTASQAPFLVRGSPCRVPSLPARTIFGRLESALPTPERRGKFSQFVGLRKIEGRFAVVAGWFAGIFSLASLM